MRERQSRNAHPGVKAHRRQRSVSFSPAFFRGHEREEQVVTLWRVGLQGILLEAQECQMRAQHRFHGLKVSEKRLTGQVSVVPAIRDEQQVATYLCGPRTGHLLVISACQIIADFLELVSKISEELNRDISKRAMALKKLGTCSVKGPLHDKSRQCIPDSQWRNLIILLFPAHQQTGSPRLAVHQAVPETRVDFHSWSTH